MSPLTVLAAVGRLLQRGLTSAMDLALPRTCAACRRALAEPRVRLCDECAAGLALAVGGDYCRQCGLDVGPHLLQDRRCAECRRHPRPRVARIVRVGRHRGTLRRLVLALKREPFHDDLLGGMLAMAVERELSDQSIELVVPIPTPWGRRWSRGYQPTELLARRVARHVGVPWRAILRMARAVRPQTGLSAADRERNIRGAFRCGGRWTGVWARRQVRGRVVCLVDDVSTTGATLREAAGVLREAGAKRVVAAVVSRATLHPGPGPA